jgi:hypothetical protein
MPSSLGRFVTRLQALEALAVGIVAAAIQAPGLAQDPTFPKGEILRAILKDYAPEDLAGGATLFHEHMQVAPDLAAAAAAAHAANGLPPLPARPRGGGTSPAPPDIMHDIDLMSDEVVKTKSADVACIVEPGQAAIATRYQLHPTGLDEIRSLSERDFDLSTVNVNRLRPRMRVVVNPNAV